MQKKYVIYSIGASLALLTAGCVFVSKNSNENVNVNGEVVVNTTNSAVNVAVNNVVPAVVPAAVPAVVPAISPIQKIQEKVTELATNIAQSVSKPSVLLNVAFASQAPLGVWDPLHEDACEESAMIMAHNYVKNLPLNNQIMEDGLQKMILWEGTQGLGYSITMLNVQKTMKEYLGNGKTRIIDNPTVEDLKKELSAGNPIIVPAAGRELGNPNFTAPGPVYHMYLLIGYDDARKEFITNDPGTRNGHLYRYNYDVVMNTMHDWNESDIDKGKKTVLVVEKGQ